MEDFVSFEIAKKLKEKGFPQRPDYFNYSSYYDWDGLRKIHSLCNASVWFDPNISRDNIYFAPTISQVLKWLRKKKNIFVVTFIADDSDTPLTYEIYRGTECLLTHHGKYFTLQEWDKCNLVGIEDVIDNNFI